MGKRGLTAALSGLVLVAMFLMVGCPIDIGSRQKGKCLVSFMPPDPPGLEYVPCSWCEQGAGMIGGNRCYWRPDE